MQSVRAPLTGIYHEEPCQAFVGQSSYGSGTLYITENDVRWVNQDNTGMALQYQNLAVHAISTDEQAFPHHCLYVMYNENILNATDSSDEDEDPVSEIRFVPTDSGHLKDMFNAMSDCQCLHPDEEDSDCGHEQGFEFEDGAAGEGFFTAPEGVDHLTPQGLATMQRLEAMLGQAQDTGGSGDNLESEVNGLHLDGEEEEDGQFDDA